MSEISQYDLDTLAYLKAAGVEGALLDRVRALVEEVAAVRADGDDVSDAPLCGCGARHAVHTDEEWHQMPHSGADGPFYDDDGELAGGVILFKPGEVWFDPDTGEFTRESPAEISDPGAEARQLIGERE